MNTYKTDGNTKYKIAIAAFQKSWKRELYKKCRYININIKLFNYYILITVTDF